MENTTTQPTPPTQEPVAPQVSNISQTPPPQKRNKSKMIYVLIILFSVLFLIAAVTLGMKFYNESNKETVLISTPSPTITPDPTADWKTYEGNGFSVKYPNAWDKGTDTTSQNPNAYPRFYQIIESGSYDSLFEKGYGYKSMSFMKVKSDASISEVKNFIARQYITSNLKEEIFKIDNTDVTLYTGCLNPEVCEKVIAYLIPLKGGEYLLLTTTDDSNLTDQILSTFKFTDSTTTPTPTFAPRVSFTPTPNPTANWNTYTKGNVSFKYPPSWHSGVSGDGTILLNDKTFDETLVMEPGQVAITLEIIADPQLIKLYSDTGIYKNKKQIGEYEFEITDTMTNSYAQVKFARIIKDEIMYRFGLTNLKDEGIFNQTLATFRINN